MKKIERFSEWKSDIDGDVKEREKMAHVIEKKLPLSPAKWVSEPRYKKISRIRMSCGGGLGGAQWFEYVYRVDHEELSKKFIKVERIDGKEIIINTSNVVDIEDFTLVEAQYYNNNDNFPIGEFTATGLIEDWQIVKLV